MTGVITRIFLTRGFAFVRGDDKETYFLQVDELSPGTQWEQMRVGSNVVFEPRRTGGAKGNGWRATQVRCAESRDVTAP
jgi:hypothetical protein